MQEWHSKALAHIRPRSKRPRALPWVKNLRGWLDISEITSQGDQQMQLRLKAAKHELEDAAKRVALLITPTPEGDDK